MHRCVPFFCENHYGNEWCLFVGCGNAKEVWMTVGLWDSLSHFMANAMDFASFFFDIIQNWQQYNVLDFVMMLWCISKRRNEKVWEDVEKHVCYSVQLARDHLQQWQEAMRGMVGTHMDSKNRRDSWLPLSVEEVKCNADTTLFKEKSLFWCWYVYSWL